MLYCKLLNNIYKTFYYLHPMKKFFLILPVSILCYGSLSAQIFTKVTGTALNSALESEGNIWADYDKDGDMDVLMTIQGHYTIESNPTKSFYLFQNNCGAFTRVIAGDLVNDTLNGANTASWVDFDNDGYEDILAIFADSPHRKSLYRNNGDGTFSKTTAPLFVNDTSWAIASSLVDMDNDGDLDVYYANEDIYAPNVTAAHDIIYRNNGSGSYTRLNVLLDSTSSRNGIWGDYDNDGYMDLFISSLPWSSSVGITRLFHNSGSGTFTHVYDITKSTTTGNYSYGASFVDYDNDRDLDIFLVNSFGHPNTMFQNNGSGVFTDATAATGLTENRPNNDGHTWGDIDNDGDLDLFMTTFNKNILYINNGNGTFTENTTEVAVDEAVVESTGPNLVDIDNDGDLDLLVSNNNLAPENFFYTNNGNSNHWISIRAKGVTSNKEAIGARVYLKATIGGSPKWQMREISANPYAQGRSSITPEIHFGIGNAVTIDSIKVVWPASATTQHFTNVTPDRFVEITEGSSTVAAVNTCSVVPGFVLNGIYLHLSGGTSSTPAFFVIDSPNRAGIVRQSGGGHIYTEGQYDFVQWNAGAGIGDFVFPFGVPASGGSEDYIPFSFNKTTTASSNITASTWSTNPQNMPHPAVSNVPAVYSMTGIGDSVTTAVDRFWDIRTSGTVTANITFSYRGSENTTSAPTASFKSQRWNGTSPSNPWNLPDGPGNTGVSSGIGTVGPLRNVTGFSPFVMVREMAPLVKSSYAIPKKKLDEGFYEAASGLVYFNYHEEYLAGTLQFKVYNSKREVVISNTVQSGAINSTAKVLGDNRYVINCNCNIGTGYYILEITNDKKEVVRMRFHYDAGLYPPC